MIITNTKPATLPLHPAQHAAKDAAAQHEQLVRKTEKWVSQTFFGTLMKHMHDGPYKSDMLDGGKGGKAFQQMYDQQLADRMSHGVGAKLVDSIVRRIEAKAAYAKNAKAGTHAPSSTTIPAGARRNHASLVPGKIHHALDAEHLNAHLAREKHKFPPMSGKIPHTPEADHAQPSLQSRKRVHPHGLGAKPMPGRQSLAHLI